MTLRHLLIPPTSGWYSPSKEFGYWVKCSDCSSILSINSCFQNNVEIHVAHIQSGLSQLGNLHAFTANNTNAVWARAAAHSHVWAILLQRWCFHLNCCKQASEDVVYSIMVSHRHEGGLLPARLLDGDVGAFGCTQPVKSLKGLSQTHNSIAPGYLLVSRAKTLIHTGFILHIYLFWLAVHGFMMLFCCLQFPHCKCCVLLCHW